MDPVVPNDFVEQVKDVLTHLWDFPYLQHHKLLLDEAYTLPIGSTTDQFLRQRIIAAIESLKPPRSPQLLTPQMRPFQMLNFHYVEGLTVQQAAHELGISPRQAHRDLRRGEENVAEILWALRSGKKKRAIELSSYHEEIDRLGTHLGSTNLGLLLERAQNAVQKLAAQRNVRFEVEAPVEPVIVSCDQTVALQVLVNTLSNIVQQVQQGIVSLNLQVRAGVTSLTIQYAPSPLLAGAILSSKVVEQLVHHLDWTMEQHIGGDGVHTLVVQILSPRPTVLVIDDNQGLVELLERYLTYHACRVLTATTGSAGLQIAQEMIPDAILLDIMMPQMDGWEILQTLRYHPRTATIPVVVCTVFDDPELAYSLGASLFLPKPVRRDSVLTALRQLNIV